VLGKTSGEDVQPEIQVAAVGRDATRTPPGAITGGRRGAGAAVAQVFEDVRAEDVGVAGAGAGKAVFEVGVDEAHGRRKGAVTPQAARRR